MCDKVCQYAALPSFVRNKRICDTHFTEKVAVIKVKKVTEG